MAGIVLDASKSGLEVKEHILAGHQALYKSRPPRWTENEKDIEKFSSRNENHAKRPDRRLDDPGWKKTHVLDRILDEGQKEKDKWLANLENLFPDSPGTDKALEEPWQDAQARAQKCLARGITDLDEDLRSIERHVEQMAQERQERLKGERSDSKDGVAFTDLEIEKRQDVLRELSRRFASELTAHDLNIVGKNELEELKASYAYILKPHNRFPFDVACRTLCTIKARSLGSYKAVEQSFYERFKISKSFLQNPRYS